jgi:hypothetical protein
MRRELPVYRTLTALGIALFAALAFNVPVVACPTGLGIIPTADTVKPGRYDIEIQLDGRVAGPATRIRLLNSEFGLAPHLEAGLDFDLSRESSSRRLFNAKYLLVEDHKRSPALAVGVFNVGAHLKGSSYVVASHRMKPVRVHLGAARIRDHDRCFLGGDCALTSKCTLMADYTSGHDNFASVGCTHQFTPHLGVLFAVELPAKPEAGDTSFTAHLVLT